MFDVPNNEVETLLSEFEDVKEDGQSLEKLTSLPPLQDTNNINSFSSGSRDSRSPFRRSSYSGGAWRESGYGGSSSRPNRRRSASYDDFEDSEDEGSFSSHSQRQRSMSFRDDKRYLRQNRNFQPDSEFGSHRHTRSNRFSRKSYDDDDE